jgi:hypothetical protein
MDRVEVGEGNGGEEVAGVVKVREDVEAVSE